MIIQRDKIWKIFWMNHWIINFAIMSIIVIKENENEWSEIRNWLKLILMKNVIKNTI